MNLTHILELDRMVLAWFNGSDSLFIDSLATTLTSGFTWIPLYVILIYVIIKNNDTMPQIFLTIGCAVPVWWLACRLNLSSSRSLADGDPATTRSLSTPSRLLTVCAVANTAFSLRMPPTLSRWPCILVCSSRAVPWPLCSAFGRPLTAGRASISGSITHSTSSSDYFGAQSWVGRHTHFTVVGASL